VSVAAVAMLLAASAAASVRAPVDLKPGEMLRAGQRADEVRSYRARLEAGRAYLLEVEQDALDLVVELTTPEGASSSFDAPVLRLETERVLIEPRSSGHYVFSLGSQEYKGGIAAYALRLSELPAGEAADPRRRAALAAETRGAQANRAGGMANWHVALEAYQQAAEAWQALADGRVEARARLASAWLLYMQVADNDGAAREAQAAAELYSAIGDRSRHASALQVLAAAEVEMAGEIKSPATGAAPAPEVEALFERALARLAEAARIKGELGEDYERARIVNDIGVAHHLRGNWQAARRHYREAAAVHHAAEEWAEELKATANLAAVDISQGHLVEALHEYERVLDLVPPGELPAWRGDVLDNMGAAYRALGDVDAALAAYTRALAVHEAFESPSGRGRSLSGIGVTYYSAGEWELAREYLERALPVRRDARDGPGQVSTLLFLGGIYLQQGEVESAIEAHREAAALATSRRERARAQVWLGRDLVAAGRVEEALQVLALARQTAAEADTPVAVADALLESGTLRLALGRLDEAVTTLQEALDQYEALGWTTGEAQSHYQLARAARAGGDPARALQHALASIELTEQLRSLIANPELRASFLATRRDPYSLYIDVAARLAAREQGEARRTWLARALGMSERARTRAMLDQLQEAAAGLGRASGADLAERRNGLYRELAGLRFRQGRLLEREQDAAALAETRAALSRVETELQLLESEWRRADPVRAALAAPQTLDAPAMQAALGDNAMLLQYELGEERSWLFSVSAEAVAAHELPPRARIEALARRAHELLQSPLPDPVLRRERDEALASLSALLLGPVPALKPRLVVAADGALHYLPFAVLPVAGEGEPRQPLVASHELVNVPSLSVLAVQRALSASRPPPARTVAVFADPVFQPDDPRFGLTAVAAGPDIGDEGRPRADALSAEGLPRLPGTALEAQAIAALVPEGERLVVTGFDASRAAVLDAELGAYRMVHFATHALVDDRYPALSALALSRFAADRSPVESFLRLHDLYELELGAGLVTLSACATGLGRELRGEGLLGLARAFLHAGSSSVVASLWQVPDRATAQLMRVFYELQLSDGLSPAAALRQAQLAVRAERRWRDPYHWAAFVAYGEWRPAGEARATAAAALSAR
jgi:CHAT domain-containing protein/tetratricopeptide (TPR) repeat protein